MHNRQALRCFERVNAHLLCQLSMPSQRNAVLQPQK